MSLKMGDTCVRCQGSMYHLVGNGKWTCVKCGSDMKTKPKVKREKGLGDAFTNLFGNMDRFVKR